MKLPRLPAGEIARRAAQATESSEAYKVERAATIAAAKASGIPKKHTPRPEHGQQIFVFNHLQKNHVVYSLTQAMNNNAALSQIPFNGKKSVPAALRKDLWHPLARIVFPPGCGAIGLSAFQKLREYRRRHELEWGNEIALDKDGKPRSIKDRNKLICDQKANSVADMAAVLSRLQATQITQTEETEKTERTKPKPENIGLIGEGSGAQVEILWSDLHDAEYAKKWGGNVEHGEIGGGYRRRETRQAAIESYHQKERENAEKKLNDPSWYERVKAAGAKKKAENIARAESRAESPRSPEDAAREPKSAEKQSAYHKKAAENAERKLNDPEWYERVKAEGSKRKAAKVAGSELKPESPRNPEDTPRREHKSAKEPLEDTARREAKLANQKAAQEAYEKKAAENAERKLNDPEWYERVKAEGSRRKVAKVAGSELRAESPKNPEDTPRRKPKSAKEQPEDTARREAKLAKQKAAQEAYEKKAAENAERKLNDPEWYEKVKAEGLKRKAEKGLVK